MKVVGVRTKQDITIKPITSHDLMPGQSNLESLTSSEEESEEHDESHKKGRKKKSHRECIEKQESEETEKPAAAALDTTHQSNTVVQSHDHGATGSNQPKQASAEQAVLSGLDQLKLADTYENETSEPAKREVDNIGGSLENKKNENISPENSISENLIDTDTVQCNNSESVENTDDPNAREPVDDDGINVQNLESLEIQQNGNSGVIKEIDSRAIADHSIRNAGIRDLPENDMDSFEVLQPSLDDMGSGNDSRDS